MSELTQHYENLPATIEELNQYVQYGKGRHKARLAALKTLESIEDSKNKKKELFHKMVDELVETWVAHAKLGELLGSPIEGGDKKSEKYHLEYNPSDLSPDDRRFARTFWEALQKGIIGKLEESIRKRENSPAYLKPYHEIISLKRKNNIITEPLLPNKYSVIVADPPWPIQSMLLDDKWKQDLEEEKYMPLSTEEISKLDVDSIAHSDCSLFLWTTHTYLQEAFEIIKAWGFKYHVCITWDKGGGWSVCGFHRRTEFCLYAYKGKMNISQTGKYIPTLITEPKRKHSQKPEIMYKLIEEHTPAPRIELFAREKRNNWASWGNQL